MVSRRKRDILFNIETEAQFDSVMPLLVHLRDKTNITFDIVVPSAASDATMPIKNVYESSAKAVLNHGFRIVRSIDGVVLPDHIINTRYQVFLSAYIYQWHYESLNVKYRIMFPYASYYFNKPHWTIKQFIDQDYYADALLSHAVGTKDITDIFTKTYLVSSLKLMDFRRKIMNREKPVLFFAPTYDEIDFAVNFLKNIDTIKERYTVIMRGHHRVSRVSENQDVAASLHQAADKIYDAGSYSIVTPLEEADIVISDNSAVIFDAIYCGVPVALYSQDPNSFSFKEINTHQFELVKKGDILWTSNPGEIVDIADRTLTPVMRRRQEVMQDILFPEKTNNPIEQWMKVLYIYLDDNIPYEYSLVKQYWIDKINNPLKENQVMRTDIESLSQQIRDRDDIIYSEQHPGVKTAAKRFVKACLCKMSFLRRKI